MTWWQILLIVQATLNFVVMILAIIKYFKSPDE